jgi:hypothetical protein
MEVPMTSWMLRDIGIDALILIFILLMILIASGLWLQVLLLNSNRARLAAVEELLARTAERDEDRARTLGALRATTARIEQRILDEFGEAPETFFWDRMRRKTDRKTDE